MEARGDVRSRTHHQGHLRNRRVYELVDYLKRVKITEAAASRNTRQSRMSSSPRVEDKRRRSSSLSTRAIQKGPVEDRRSVAPGTEDLLE